MSAEPTAGGADDSEDRSLRADAVRRLSRSYREYIGEPDKERDIYIGFGMFFAGLALAVVSFAVFIYSAQQKTGTAFYWQLRELALVMSLVGLPMIVASIVVLLPTERWTRIAGAVGGAVSIAAVVVLVDVYPYAWTKANGTDGSVITVSLYAIGLVLLAAATGTALVAQYLDRALPEQSATEQSADEGDVSDEQVASDIEEALDDTTLSWGGIEQDPETERLDLNVPEDVDINQTELEGADAPTFRSESEDVDDAVTGLRELQGGNTTTDKIDDTGEKVDALTEFREQREADEELETGVDDGHGLLGWLGRLRARLKRFFSR